MTRFDSSRRLTSAFLVLTLAAAAACGDDGGPGGPGAPVDPVLFRSYVAIGNSITAGFQSGGINDSTQRESYARLLAEQMRTTYRYPSVGKVGCPPPIENLLAAALNPGSLLTCSAPAQSGPGPFNNVAVPGANSFDPTNPGMSSSNALAAYLLGPGGTQVSRARAADPSFVSVWIGNNDILGDATDGLLRAPNEAGTPPDQFAANYAHMMSSLLTPNVRGGVLIGVVDPSRAPLLVPASALANTGLRQALTLIAGRAIAVRADCDGSASLISLALVVELRVDPSREPTIGCAKAAGQMGGVGDEYVLDAAEQAAVRATVAAYNAYLRAKADSLGFAYYDPNPALLALRESGRIPSTPNFGNLSHPFGDYVSLDGIHPAGPAHRLVADELIRAINAKYGVAIPPLDVE